MAIALIWKSPKYGKVLREGMGQATGVGAADALDMVITNALIVDAKLGVR